MKIMSLKNDQKSFLLRDASTMIVKIEDGILHCIFRSAKVMQEVFAELSYYYEGKRYFDGYNMDVVTVNKYMTEKDRLSKGEKELEKILSNHKDIYYVIAYIQNDFEARDHELRHARFYIDSEYRRKVMKKWSALDTQKKIEIITKLKSLGYREDKWVDEAQAYEMI
jgi:hypothetical protein